MIDEEESRLRRFLELRHNETGNVNYHRYRLHTGLKVDGNMKMKKECDTYYQQLNLLKESLKEFEWRIEIAKEKIEENFSQLRNFSIGFNRDYCIFTIGIMLEKDYKAVLEFSLFTIESYSFRSMIGNQFMRRITLWGIQNTSNIFPLFPTLKHFQVPFSQLESIWKHITSYSKGMPLCGHMRYFKMMDEAGDVVLSYKEEKERLLLIAKGTYDILPCDLKEGNQEQILYYVTHKQPHFRNIFYRFYGKHITLLSYLIERELPKELLPLTSCSFIGISLLELI